ncbi:very short patch repair endonuclease [Nocardioides luteus]|uniref:very short patch repair endonuclease n=1 Tax=Nocardioides luteus TaxID=1844 RepID=UPI001C432F98|nr:very short patch repair endonuclease [Nocardioides luteus]
MNEKSWAANLQTRRSMQANRGRDTKPELAIRRLVHAAGLRYQVDTRPVPSLNRRADLVFRGPKVAIFIDGCFWHGCPDHHTVARTNASFWAEKVRRTRERDIETAAALEAAGWIALRIWEHEDPAQAANRVVGVVRGRRQDP